jgi:hypothetical protein
MIGADCKMYYASAPLAGAPSTGDWTELGIVRDLTLNEEYEEIDATVRGSGRRKEYEAGLLDDGLEVEVKYKPSDPGYQFLEAARGSAATGPLPISLAIMSGDIAANGTRGTAGNWIITKFSQPQQLASLVTVQMTIKPHNYVVPYVIG